MASDVHADRGMEKSLSFCNKKNARLAVEGQSTSPCIDFNDSILFIRGLFWLIKGVVEIIFNVQFIVEVGFINWIIGNEILHGVLVGVVVYAV